MAAGVQVKAVYPLHCNLSEVSSLNRIIDTPPLVELMMLVPAIALEENEISYLLQNSSLHSPLSRYVHRTSFPSDRTSMMDLDTFHSGRSPYMCAACIGDEHLKTFIKEHAVMKNATSVGNHRRRLTLQPMRTALWNTFLDA